MGEHSGPYKTQDPNKSEEVIDTEAALAYARLLRRERADDIAKDLGISRATFYRRIEMLTLRLGQPSRSLLVAISHEELDELARMTKERLQGEVSNADFAKLAAELRQQNTAILRLYEDASDEAPEQDDPEIDEWVAEVAGENEAEIREVRGA